MRVRTSNHGFVFNIHPDNMVPSDLFQGFIVIPHRDWATIQLPFANMAYTGYGYGKFEKKLLDTKNILSVRYQWYLDQMQFNIAIHETKDTDFCFDIEYIKGINELDVEGKRPEMKKGMEKELMKTVDMKERAPPSQLECLLDNGTWNSRFVLSQDDLYDDCWFSEESNCCE